MNKVATEFAIAVFCQVQLPNTREVLYRDYVDFCLARNESPLSITDFCREFRGMIRKALTMMARG